MAYKKVYYSDIWRLTSASGKKCNEWQDNLQSLDAALMQIICTDKYTGKSAENVKTYLSEVHKIIIVILNSILSGYISKAGSYYSGYINRVDSGTGSDNRDVSYTTIVYDEVNNDNGTVKKQINSLINMVNQVSSDALSVKQSIADLVYIAANPRNSDLILQLNTALGKANYVNNKVISFEETRKNDFVEIDRLISQAKRIIDRQLGNNRVPMIQYHTGAIGAMCDINSIQNDMEAISGMVADFENSDEYENAMNLMFNRDEIIAEEEKEDREWVQWIAIGVAIVGSVALIVATAGAASPGACIIVGGLTGALTKATEKFADNYVENGSLIDGMDWGEFTKDVLTEATVGAISGGMGAISQGSAIEQPIKKAVFSLAESVMKETATGVIDIGVDVIGEGFIAGKPGVEILDTLKDDTVKMAKNIVTKGSRDFIEEYITQGFKIDTSHKGTMKKIKENIVSGLLADATEGAANVMWDMGEAVCDPNSSENMESILKRNLRETIGNMTKDVSEGIVSEVWPDADKIKNSAGKIAVGAIDDTAADTAGKISKGVTGRAVDYFNGDEKDASKILGDIWDEDLDNGLEIGKSTRDKFISNANEEVKKDAIFKNKLKGVDYDKDGKIELVQFENYAVTKEDYDAAVKNAGKGAYKNQTVQDILGLPKDMDLSKAETRVESIDILEEYSSAQNTNDRGTNATKIHVSNARYKLKS